MSGDGESGIIIPRMLRTGATQPKDKHLERKAKPLSKGNGRIESNIIFYKEIGSLKRTNETLRNERIPSRSTGKIVPQTTSDPLRK